MTPFEFEDLPTEIAVALNGLLDWRIAKEKGQYEVAEAHLARLDSSALVLLAWCSEQGKLRQMIDDTRKAPDRVDVIAGRAKRKDRIARGNLFAVPNDRDKR